ncbi:hypothetical protein M1555_04935 [Patescibacteria group bacterium]|nr:hypothetical protein [Patescibacteria group bacterium]
MNRDALLATLIGLGLGLVITGALILTPSLLRLLPKITLPKVAVSMPKSAKTPAPRPTPAAFGLTVDSPLPNAIEHKTDLIVSGTTGAGATVVVQGLTDDDVTVVGKDGKYVGKITLSEGKNTVTVTSYGKDKQKGTSVVVYYTPESL